MTTVVSNSSPLIALERISHLDLLEQVLFHQQWRASSPLFLRCLSGLSKNRSPASAKIGR
jgi:hypothetical protein